MALKPARGSLPLAVAAGLVAGLLTMVGAAPVAAATPTRFPTSNAAVTVPTALPPLTNPENAYADDGVYAVGTLEDSVIGGVNTGGQFAHGFGDFGFDAIPADATITSVTAEMQYRFSTTGTTALDYDVIALSGGSVLASANGTSEPTSDTVLATAPFTATRDQLLDGALVVEVAATSGAGTTSMLVDYVSVTVAYTVPEPSITVPADIARTTTSASGVVVTYEATATDDQDGPLMPTCTPPSGSLFPVGTTTVTCTVADSDEHTATASFTVAVRRSGGPTPTPPDTSTIAPSAADEAPADLSPLLLASVGSAAFVVALARLGRWRARRS